ncbi:MAG: radical SAM protein [Cyclobacteriaceae bacterium]
MSYKLSYYTTFTDPIDPDAEHKQVIAFSARTGTALVLDTATVDKIRNDRIHEVPEEILVRLFTEEIVVKENEDELREILHEFKVGQTTSDFLGMVITPTANCQLGCNYCGQSHTKLTLSQDIADRTLSHITSKLEKRTYKGLDITWYGAEPLMGYSSMAGLSADLIDLAEEKKIHYSASMITNGLSLKPRIFHDLVEKYRCTNFQITIDGVKETHDNSRMTKKGIGTFDAILKNVASAVRTDIYKKHNCLITIRINVHKHNYHEVDSLIELLAEMDLHKDIIVSLAPIHDWGNNNADESVGIDHDLFATLEIDWLMKMHALGYRKSGYLPQRMYGTCMTTDKDAELIDANGDVSYCWEVPYTDGLEDSDASLVLGNITKPGVYRSEDYQNAPLRNWYDDILEGKNNSENCRSCKLLPVCGGHCPVSWYKGKRACPTFKFNLEDKLFLQFLQNQ